MLGPAEAQLQQTWPVRCRKLKATLQDRKGTSLDLALERRGDTANSSELYNARLALDTVVCSPPCMCSCSGAADLLPR